MLPKRKTQVGIPPTSAGACQAQGAVSFNVTIKKMFEELK
jgi:hypothetical protein